MRCLRPKPVCVQEEAEDEGETCRWKRAHDSAHDGYLVLASGRNAHVLTPVPGAVVWEAAGVLQRRSRTARIVEHTGYAKDALAGAGRKGLWSRTTSRDAENH